MRNVVAGGAELAGKAAARQLVALGRDMTTGRPIPRSCRRPHPLLCR